MFLRIKFFNFFLSHMVWKYQNEISPIFYYGKKLKTSEKLLKIPDIQPPDWKHPYWMTRYNVQRLLYNMFQGKIENIIKQFLGKIFFITGTWSFLALSLLYIGPNLFLPPLIRSCRTAEMEKYPLFQNKKTF